VALRVGQFHHGKTGSSNTGDCPREALGHKDHIVDPNTIGRSFLTGLDFHHGIALESTTIG